MPHGKESRCFAGSHRSRLEKAMLRARKKEAEAMRLKAATDEKADAGRDKCVSRPGTCGESFAAIREG
jgi:hypothetical protein